MLQNKLLENWRYYLKDIISPDDYINMGFYFMMSAALQRRVWIGPKQMPLFPNLYMVFVGPPAVGKGRVIKPIINMMKRHRLDELPKTNEAQAFISKLAQEMNMEDPLKIVKDSFDAPEKKHISDYTDKLLIPVAPESCSFEQLLIVMARNLRVITTMIEDENGNKKKEAYLHRSLCFVLEEISSLFRRNKDDIVKFLLNAFDCGDYDHETKNKGIDLIRNMCLNFLGGTTVSFLEESFDDKLLTDGWSSRVIFVYAKGPRHNKFGFAQIDESQLSALEEVSQHIKKLATLYGGVKFSPQETPEAFEIMRKYFEETLPIVRSNNSEKLDSYYGRKNAHAMKLATAIHFSRSLKMELFPEDCEEALRLLEHLEKNMHLALDFTTNRLAKPANSLLLYLRRSHRDVPLSEITMEFYSQVDSEELDEIIRYLTNAGKIQMVNTGSPPRVCYRALSSKGTKY